MAPLVTGKGGIEPRCFDRESDSGESGGSFLLDDPDGRLDPFEEERTLPICGLEEY